MKNNAKWTVVAVLEPEFESVVEHVEAPDAHDAMLEFFRMRVRDCGDQAHNLTIMAVFCGHLTDRGDTPENGAGWVTDNQPEEARG